jgi:PPOX class probable FMN-dependent enzyme
MSDTSIGNIIGTVEELEAIYGAPGEPSLVKETPFITEQYKAYIEASPFLTLATAGPEGLDCSPRGDIPGFVRVADERTLLMPDRLGNNRCDSLKNILRDPRVALCFLIPGSTNALRVNGTAQLSVDPELLESFAINGKPPRSVAVIRTEAVYFQCGRAIVRSMLWESEARVDPATLPTPGEILAEMSKNRVGGSDYDTEWKGRAEKTLW